VASKDVGFWLHLYLRVRFAHEIGAQDMKRPLFGEDDEQQMWLEGTPSSADSNVLITVSSNSGEKTVLATGEKMIESKAKLFVQAPAERVVIGTRKWQVQMMASLRWLGYVGAAVLLTFSVLSFSGVMKARIVLTGSMEPAISVGDIILTTPTSRLTPGQGDVVAYTAKRFDGSPVGVFSHRIIGGDAQTGFIVQGDANPSPDVQRPLIPDIEGTVVFVIPLLGKILAPKSLFILVPLIFGFWLIRDALKNED
jgi:signal peptidase I